MNNGAVMMITTLVMLAIAATFFPVFVGFDHGWHGLVPAIVCVFGWF